ncbi:MAG TPA: hypothetical protein VIV60_19420 [Polyangiaceae bacterium]
MSIILVTFIVPLRNCSGTKTKEGATKTIKQVTGFIIFWGLACVYIYWKLPS